MTKQELQSALIRATEAAFQTALDRTRSETLYAFALFTNGEGSYFTATCNTEESLRRSAAAKGLSGDELRWSPCDWEYHQIGDDHFRPVASILEREWSEDYSEFRLAAEQAFESALAALEAFSHSPVFAGLREGVMLNLLMGDQSDEQRSAWAKRLNPGSAQLRAAPDLNRITSTEAC